MPNMVELQLYQSDWISILRFEYIVLWDVNWHMYQSHMPDCTFLYASLTSERDLTAKFKCEDSMDLLK